MKVAKYTHSCIFVEEEGKNVLIDPGIYTYNEKLLDLNAIERLDYLLITHEHGDHFYLPLIREILNKFPDLRIISNPSVVALLAKENIKASSGGDELIRMEKVSHEKLFDGAVPENVMFTIFGKLSHPGDSLNFETKASVIAMPVQAPWGSTVDCVQKALSLKPNAIIPIHDYHWRSDFREQMYVRLESFFGEKGIKFLNPLLPGTKFEI